MTHCDSPQTLRNLQHHSDARTVLDLFLIPRLFSRVSACECLGGGLSERAPGSPSRRPGTTALAQASRVARPLHEVDHCTRHVPSNERIEQCHDSAPLSARGEELIMTRGVGGTSPANVQVYLKGAQYPSNKEALLATAKHNSAPKEILDILENLPEDEFGGPQDVMKAYAALEPERDEEQKKAG
jgi:hypothetical protein